LEKKQIKVKGKSQPTNKAHLHFFQPNRHGESIAKKCKRALVFFFAQQRIFSSPAFVYFFLPTPKFIVRLFISSITTQTDRRASANKGLASGFNRASLQVSLPSVSFVQG